MLLCQICHFVDVPKSQIEQHTLERNSTFYSTMIGATTLFQEGDDTTDSLLCLHLAAEVFNSHSSVILWSLQQLITPHIDITSVVYM
jgi:hypothetical protein